LSSLERREGEHQPAVRLGLHLVSGLSGAAADRIEAARFDAPFSHPQDLALRARLDGREMQLLAAADALQSLAGQRRQQVWQASALKPLPALLAGSMPEDAQLELPMAPEGEEVVWDYAATGLTLRRHPLALLRPRLAELGLKNSAELARVANGRRTSTCGSSSASRTRPAASRSSSGPMSSRPTAASSCAPACSRCMAAGSAPTASAT
jgi:error-prone DNA polymerase